MNEQDSELARFTAQLERRSARLGRFLRLRAAAGLILLAFCASGVALAGAFALAGMGLLEAPALTRWTSGFDVVLAIFMPTAFAWLTGGTGYRWWRERHLSEEAPDTRGL